MTNTAFTRITIGVHYDPEVTDAESVATAIDRLLDTALSTPGIMDEYGNPEIEATEVAQ